MNYDSKNKNYATYKSSSNDLKCLNLTKMGKNNIRTKSQPILKVFQKFTELKFINLSILTVVVS